MIEITLMCMAAATITSLIFAMERREKRGSKREHDRRRERRADSEWLQDNRVQHRRKKAVFNYYTIGE